VLEQIADDVRDIILVDGNSTGATLITARSCRPPSELGRKKASAKAARSARVSWPRRGDIVVTMGADGSMAPGEIWHYLHFLAIGYDFVKGSRFTGGKGSLDITTFRWLGNRRNG
jgi:glycosyltransferase involved in cell wall biosynthesis